MHQLPVEQVVLLRERKERCDACRPEGAREGTGGLNETLEVGEYSLYFSPPAQVRLIIHRPLTFNCPSDSLLGAALLIRMLLHTTPICPMVFATIMNASTVQTVERPSGTR